MARQLQTKLLPTWRYNRDDVVFVEAVEFVKIAVVLLLDVVDDDDVV